jgi:hypothetical protein
MSNVVSRRGPIVWGALLVLIALPVHFASEEAEAIAGGAPAVAVAPPDPDASCKTVEQGPMVHVFDTRAMEGPATYVNDHTLVRGPDGAWHLFGIFHREPMGDDTEIDFVHAVANERDPAKWQDGAFVAAAEPHTIALRADEAAGETHLWAPHVVAAEGRWFMFYQGGGADDYHASMRIAESTDLYRWSRIGAAPLFEDFCEARDPMILRRDDVWLMHYTRCESLTRKVSGVAIRSSRDLIHWTEPVMAAAFAAFPTTSNSAYTESPFVFEHGGYHYLSVTAYPLAWDATLLYRSPAPLAFPDVPITRLRGHAAEWVFDERGGAFMTHAGPGQRGVWLSRITGI